MSRNILIVEDADTAATTLEIALLNIPGAAVARAADGWQALEYLTPEKGHAIDALITDLEMPLIDGFELIRRVRAEERFAAMPIVVISASSNPEARRTAMQLGANAYFSKPCSALEIQRKVLELLP